MKIFTPFFLRCIGICFTLILLAFSGKATHIRGGYITYSSDTTSGANHLRIFFKLVIYSDSRSTADNPTATISTGDGSQISANRISKISLNDNSYRNTYYLEYTYPSPGTYNVSYTEANRTVGIMNIVNSETRPFCIASQVKIDPFLGGSRSPRLLLDPVLEINVNPTTPKISYNLTAFDLNSDSLAYQLVPALQAPGTAISNYTIPAFASINQQTGELSFLNNGTQGMYNLVVKITEYRAKLAIGYVLVDFTINYRNTTTGLNPTFTITNRAALPIDARNHVSLTVSQPLTILVQFTDPQATTTQLSCRSDLLVKNQATYSASGTGNNSTGQFTFTPNATHKKNHPHLLVFRGVSKNNTSEVAQDYTVAIFVEPNTITGIRDASDILEVSGYPNPAETYITIEHPFVKKNHVLNIYDISGRLVKYLVVAPSLKTTLTGNDLPQAGQYFYAISDGVQVKQTGRFVVR